MHFRHERSCEDSSCDRTAYVMRGRPTVPALGAWLMIPSAFSAEIIAHAGFDWVCVDMQHGVIDYAQMVTMLQAVSSTAVTPLVRVPWNEPGIIGKSLDAGARGVIIPMVNSRADAERAVAACRYAPAGARSYGPSAPTTPPASTTSPTRTTTCCAS